MSGNPDGTRPVKGHRGFEIDAHLTFARPVSREEAQRTVSAWSLRPTYYGEGEVRAVRLTGPLEHDRLQQLLQLGLEGGTLRSAEVGLRGFLRSATGSTEYVPWTRNKILPRTAWADVALEQGVRYILE